MVGRDRVFLLFSILIFGIIVLKPFLLGFYHDDWATLVGASYHGGAFSLERLTWVLKTFASRPVGGVVVYLLSSVNGASPFLWQSSLASLSVLAILAQFVFLKSLTVFLQERQATMKTLFFSSLFFSYPWVLGGLNFVTAGIVILPAMILFFVAGFFALQPPEKVNGKTILLAGLFYLLSGLIYELFYFQFLLFFLMRLVGCRREFAKTAFLFLAFVVAQLAMIGWNRFSAAFGTDPVKAFNPAWLNSTINLMLGLPRAVAQAFADVPQIFTLGMLLTAFNLLALVMFLAKNDTKSFRRYVSFLGILGFCVLSALALYSLVGYSLSGVGIASRTLVVPSLLFSLALYLTDLFFRKTPRAIHKVYLLSLLTIGSVMVFVTLVRLGDWRKSWEIQKQVLQAIPRERVLQTDREALIVYRGPYEIGGVTVFQAYWDITSAMNAQFSDPSQFRHYTVGRDDWQTTWTGGKLTQTWQHDGTMIWELPARQVWVWDYSQSTFESVLTPGKI